MKREDHQKTMERAELAIQQAQEVRAFHRKRTKYDNPARKTDIRNAEFAVRQAMRPIRSALGGAPYDPVTEANRRRHDELRAMSKRVQAERRKLWKLKGKARRPKRRKRPTN